MNINTMPVVETAMLIRRSVAEVFEAFVDPAITSRFWFTKGSGRLEPGRTVHWNWEMYGHSVEVKVKAVEPNRRIVIEWEGEPDPTTVEWNFASREDGSTYVTLTNSGFGGDGDAMVHQALDSMGGFTLVLCGAKALLEHNLSLNLIADRYPDGHG
jgi:uncharacterized protein YndB with AHSA1/START domain